MSRQSEFAAEVDRLVKEARVLPAATSARVLDALEKARMDIVGRIASSPSSFSYWQLQSLLDSIDRALREFHGTASSAIADGQASAFSAGRDLIDSPLSAAGISPSLSGIPTGDLAIGQSYSARLISGLTAETQKRLDDVLHRAALGGQSIGDIVEQVGRTINGDDADASIFSQVGRRAHQIVRNEVQRVHTIASQARLDQMGERLGANADGEPVLWKVWQHNPELHPRKRHVEMSGQAVPYNGLFIVPASGAELRFPRDPNGDASETINCECTMRPEVRHAALKQAA